MPLLDAKLEVKPEVLGKLASGESKIWTAIVRDSSGAITDHIPIVQSGINTAERAISDNLANAALSQAQSEGFWDNAWGFVKQHKWGFLIGSLITAATGGTIAAVQHQKKEKARQEQEERERRALAARQAQERERQQIYNFCNELSLLLVSYVYKAEKGEIDKATLGQLIGKLQMAHELQVSGKLTIQDHEALISLRDSITSLTEKLLEGKAPAPVVEEETTNPDDFFLMKKELQKQYMVIEEIEE